MTVACPCTSGTPYAECCGPLHAGEPASTAVALMRSRFAAYALGLEHYLLTSWHPSTRPHTLNLESDIQWRRLQIVDTVAGRADDSESTVEFRASFREAGRAGLLHERSRFTRFRGRWVYLDGQARET